MNRILDKHASLKKLTKYKLKFKTKPCIAMPLQKSISIKNKLFGDYINKKDLSQKTGLCINMLQKHVIYLDEKSKQNYFTKFFENNLKNLKNTLKSIKSIISMKSSFSNTPTLFTFQNENIDNPERIASIFNNYFSTIGEKTQAKIKHHIKSILVTSQMKILTHFFFRQLTKKKSNSYSPLLISINLLDHTVSQVRF